MRQARIQSIDLSKHQDHVLSIDSGTVRSKGTRPGRREFCIWCDTCVEPLSNLVSVPYDVVGNLEH